MSCLHLACFGGDVATVKWCFKDAKLGVVPTFTPTQGWSWTHVTALGGHVAVLQWLEDSGRLDLACVDTVRPLCARWGWSATRATI